MNTLRVAQSEDFPTATELVRSGKADIVIVEFGFPGNPLVSFFVCLPEIGELLVKFVENMRLVETNNKGLARLSRGDGYKNSLEVLKTHFQILEVSQ